MPTPSQVMDEMFTDPPTLRRAPSRNERSCEDDGGMTNMSSLHKRKRARLRFTTAPAASAALGTVTGRPSKSSITELFTPPSSCTRLSFQNTPIAISFDFTYPSGFNKERYATLRCLAILLVRLRILAAAVVVVVVRVVVMEHGHGAGHLLNVAIHFAPGGRAVVVLLLKRVKVRSRAARLHDRPPLLTFTATHNVHRPLPLRWEHRLHLGRRR
mmetsp:Transcript_12249/g.27838  ORF Transcript_12249/g.27838 Transcript_12249/m.27838 type:complete len:214 (-) Transcript_12249:217-858(-)